jgi:hypothetical protein
MTCFGDQSIHFDWVCWSSRSKHTQGLVDLVILDALTYLSELQLCLLYKKQYVNRAEWSFFYTEQNHYGNLFASLARSLARPQPYACKILTNININHNKLYCVLTRVLGGFNGTRYFVGWMVLLTAAPLRTESKVQTAFLICQCDGRQPRLNLDNEIIA